MKPVLFVTAHAPPDRVGAFARLHELENVEFALFGGRSKHGPSALSESRTAPSPGAELPFSHTELPFPHRYVRQHEPARLAASGDYRAVVCSSGGRIALPATWAGARRAGAALILWTSLWAHPRSAAHLFSYLALRRLYRSADGIVTYGPHVSAYVRARGARNVHVAPQSVDNAFWSATIPVAALASRPATGFAGGGGDRSVWPGEAQVKFMFAGRPDWEKGLWALIEAWRMSGLQAPTAALVLVGMGPSPPCVPAGGAVGWPRKGTTGDTEAPAGVSCIEPVPPERLREMYADADVLVVPSIQTRTFREPWGLVVNEAMNRGLAVIASDAVGAVAGGLVRHGRNGLVVPAGDRAALAQAMVRLAGDPELRARLGTAGAQDVRAYTHDAWAEGFSNALATVGLSRTHC
jgi:glycosyltransferase involved in cell wall biosynthesis